MEVIVTGHVYNLQSDLSRRGLISRRSMTKGGFQRLPSLSNFLCPNEMAETRLESFWLGTLWESIKNMTFTNLNEKRRAACIVIHALRRRLPALSGFAISGWLWTRSDFSQKSGEDFPLPIEFTGILLSICFVCRFCLFWFNSIQWQFDSTKIMY